MDYRILNNLNLLDLLNIQIIPNKSLAKGLLLESVRLLASSMFYIKIVVFKDASADRASCNRWNGNITLKRMIIMTFI
jgi:hypothetical protein